MKTNTLLLLGGGAAALYFLSRKSAETTEAATSALTAQAQAPTDIEDDGTEYSSVPAWGAPVWGMQAWNGGRGRRGGRPVGARRGRR